MNYLDIIILILAGVGVITGLRRGFVKELSGVIALVMGFIGASTLAPYLEPTISKLLDGDQTVMAGVAWVAAFLIIVLAFNLLGMLVAKLLVVAMMGVIDKLLGGIFGAAKAILLMSLAFNLLAIAGWPSKELVAKTKYYEPTIMVGQWAFNWIKEGNISLDRLRELPKTIEEKTIQKFI